MIKPAAPFYLQVAVATPLRRVFDYLPPAGCAKTSLRPGMRLSVPFGKRHCTGILLAITDQSEVAPGRLRRALRLIDTEPLFSPDHLKFLEWSSGYYQHPIGEAIFTSLPGPLRRDRPAQPPLMQSWQLTETGKSIDPDGLARAPRQARLLALLGAHPQGLSEDALRQAAGNGWRETLLKLLEKGWASPAPAIMINKNRIADTPPTLNPDQQSAVEQICGALDRFGIFLVDGVTGSGKTEVYMRAIEWVLKAGRQALMLLPEIALTPQIIERFERRFDCVIAVLHSGLNDTERLKAWFMAREGSAGIVIGTRSAVWAPLKSPGIIVVDEEHDPSYKQQEGFRYHARDMAVMRGRLAGIPVVLGSATPSLESLYHARRGHYRHLRLPERAGQAKPPRIILLDLRRSEMRGPFSARLLELIGECLTKQQQVLLFLNRRGYAPALLCHACGWVAICPRCETAMTYHRADDSLTCHHCGKRQPVPGRCPACIGDRMVHVGHGTERVVHALAGYFPQARLARIDRDSTRRRGSMLALLADIAAGRIDILIGTQMLAKGHHFPNVALVGILDADAGLYSSDFRAPERMAQLIVQVSGRAGRAEQPGEVVIQTHHPDHPFLKRLIDQGYSGFAETALKERRESELPPYTHIALLRAEATAPAPAMNFLEAARAALPAHATGLDIYGPTPAPQPKRAGRYRAQLILQSVQRASLHKLLKPWLKRLEALPEARRVRWSLDVDPQEML